MNNKKLILIDLDGVLNEYSGNFDINFIPKMKSGTEEFLKLLSEKYEIKIFTTRNKLLTAKWLLKNKIDKYISDITDTKIPAFLYIDDRCINFEGNFKIILEKIENFKTYWKK